MSPDPIPSYIPSDQWASVTMIPQDYHNEPRLKVMLGDISTYPPKMTDKSQVPGPRSQDRQDIMDTILVNYYL